MGYLMPMRREAYPDDWETISLDIRLNRAGGKCEQCGAPANTLISRRVDDPAVWREVTFGEAEAYAAEGWHDAEWKRPIMCRLTVHHIGIDKEDGSPGDPHDKMDVRPDNLIALCQRCHLYADLPLHIQNAKNTRERKRDEARAEAGQLDLFTDES